MNIGIDIDDTISDTYEIIFNLAQKFTIEDLKRDIETNNKSFYTHLYIEGFHNWEKQETKAFLDKYYLETIENVRAKMFAVDIINKLKEEGNKIYLITARVGIEKFDIGEVTKKWLEKNNIKYDELIVDAQNKAEIAKNKNIDVFIDDSYSNCKKVSDAGIKTFIMDYIINHNLGEDGFKRVYSWPHLYREIQKIKEEI